MIAVAARIATALSLGDEDPLKFTPSELDARRRVLYAIGVLDTHAALDRGTIPILPASAFRAPPMNLDDSDSISEGGATFPSGPKVTDMTHSTMTYQAMLCQRRMYDLSREGLNTWAGRKQLVSDFGVHVDEIAEQIGNSRVPVHILIVTSGRKIHRSLELLLRRPPYRQAAGSVPSWDDYDIMLAATEVLELHLEVPPPELKPWAWKNWVQWHALAVLLAEVLTRPTDPLAVRAFEVASNAYRYYARIVADSQSGMLWKPIARLMRRVNDARQTVGASSQSPGTSHIHPGIYSHRQFSHMSLFDGTGSFESFTQSMYDTTEQGNHGVDTFNIELKSQPCLVWDEFLEDIIDASAWS